jgi:ectoine hydroxylase-related dioxygenase (phytanoyl-CoA dioxygenase family)
MRTAWRDIEEKGFVVVPRFLSAKEIEIVLNDYNLERGKPSKNLNYEIQLARQGLLNYIEPKIQAVSDAVLAEAGIDTDVTVHGVYFATDRGVNFPWHQDHESYFLFQHHYHYLNFYIPIVKANAAESNLCLIPFDALRDVSREFYLRLRGGGATQFVSDGAQTNVSDDENDISYTMPFDINGLAVAPNLSQGDLLLLRGDVIHRTQDIKTARVAVSFRRVSSKSILSHSRLVTRSPVKSEMIKKSGPMYDAIARCFTSRNRTELSLGEILPHIQGLLRGEAESPRT